MRLSLSPTTCRRTYPLLLGLTVLLLLSVLHARWDWSSWTQPRELLGDPLEIFARVRLASEQPLQPFVGFTELQRLGAPFRADWGEYPAPDSIVFFVAGQLARFTGVFGAVKIIAAFIYVLNALSFYYCARHLRWRPEWAAAGALLFAFCNYNVRWSVTLSFSQTFTLPPLVLLCAHAAKTGPLAAGGRGWHWLGGLLGMWIGIGNPYLAFFTGLLGTSTLGLALLRRSPKARIRPLVIFLAALAAVFLVANASYAWHHFVADADRPLLRNYAGSLLYALKPIDWLIPPVDHQIPWAARLGQAYVNQSQVLGEFFAGYLGFVGIAGLIGLVVLAVRRLGSRAGRPMPDAALGLLLVMAFATAGGINSLLAFAGLDIFRASQRISIFVNIWVLFFMVGWLQQRLRPAPRRITLATALVLAAFGWWEQAPELRNERSRRNLAPLWSGLQALTGRLEADLGPDAMIFQLPVRQFPEAGPMNRMMDYEHFQPFLANSCLRFSYGPLAHSREFGWQQFVSRLPAAEMVAALEASGFSAVWVNAKAYSDGGNRIVRDLLALGRTEIDRQPDTPFRVVRLRPAAAPTRPDLDDLRINHAWADPAPSSRAASLLAVNGWYPLEQDGARRWRWAAKRAEVGIWWPSSKPQAVLRFKAAVLYDNVLELRQADRVLLRLTLARGEVRTVELPLSLAPGSNRIQWTIRTDPAYPPRGDTRKLGFRIEDLELHPADSPPR